MSQLFAQPYDISATGFYFESLGAFEAQYEAHAPVEEYEIQFIDGDKEDAELFATLKLSQADLSRWFDDIESMSTDEKAALAYIVGNLNYRDLEQAIDRVRDVCIFEGNVEDHVDSMIEDGIFGAIPEFPRRYLNLKCMAEDLEMEGSLATCEFAGRSFVITNPGDF